VVNFTLSEVVSFRLSKLEGISTLRNLLGAMVLHDNSYGIVVSTADHFTCRANEAVIQAEKYGKYLRLIDRGKLNRMIGDLLPNRPWHVFLKESYSPEMASTFARKWSAKHATKASRKCVNQLLLFEENG
jgi:hypothetical protein